MSSADTALKTPLSVGRKRFLHGVFTTAIEGGIQYWAEVGEYHWQARRSEGHPNQQPVEDVDGFYATIRSNERDLEDPNDNGWGFDDLPSTLRIDLDVVERGTKLFARYCRGEINSHGEAVPEDEQKALSDDHYWRQFLAAEATHGQDGDYDATVADEIIQWGLFGESVFG